MYPFHGIRSIKGQTTRQHFIECDAEGVQITPGIDRTIHSPGLLRCHVGKRSGYELGWLGRLSFAREARSYSKTRQPGMTARGVNKDIRGLQIFVDQRPLVELPECGCETNGQAQEL